MRFFKSKYPVRKKRSEVPWFRKPISVLLTIAIICVLTGCSEQEESDRFNESESSLTDSLLQSGMFDIEEVRKSFIIKGVAFELPKKVGDLGEEWTYEKHKSYFTDGTGLATFFYNGNEMFIGGISDFETDDEKKGIIFDITLETDDCSIGGVIPNVAKKEDVINTYGEPSKINVFEERGLYRYIYGVQDSVQELFKIEHSQMFTVTFYSESDIVHSVRVVYSDLLD